MLSSRTFRRTIRGFSLLELVVVLVVIGIIAAIAVPRVSRGARGASESALSSNLSILRNAIDLYAAEHNGTYPGAEVVKQLTQYTDLSGDAAETKDATHVYGPYVRDIPSLPVGTNAGATTIKVVSGAPTVSVTSGEGWIYSSDTGKIIANADDDDYSGSKAYDEY